MNFARPELLWLLGVFPLLVVWGIRSARLRREAWKSIAQSSRLPRDGSTWWIASAACVGLALAQPRWGLDRADRLPPGHDVVLMVDVSQSMGAEDAVPNRLGVARESARSLIQELAKAPGNRVAVVAFAGRGVLRCPLTENVGAALDALDRLKPGGVRPGGTDLASGIGAALDAFDRQERAEGRTIVVFSDGEDHVGGWEQARLSERLRNELVIVHSIAIGDPEHGHVVPIKPARSSKLESPQSFEAPLASSQPLTYRGETVLSRRVDTPLEAIAKGSGGTIIRLGLASTDLGTLYKKDIEPVALQSRAEMRIAERIDRFPLFLLAAFSFALFACRLPRYRRAKSKSRLTRFGQYLRRKLISRFPIWRSRTAQAIGVSAAILTIAGAGETSRESESVQRVIDRGLAAYRAGRLDEAVGAFDTAVRLAPKLAVPRYNASATRFQLGRYAEAYAGYIEARKLANSILRIKIDYALGNSSLASGDTAAAIGHYDDCLASTAGGASLDSVRRDARINREFALRQFSKSMADQSPSPERDSQRNQPGGDRSEDDHSRGEGNQGKESSNQESEDGSAPSGAGPRTGGAGGEGQQKSSARRNPNTPDRRLDDALDQIRDARRRRLPDDDLPPDSEAQDDRKDW